MTEPEAGDEDGLFWIGDKDRIWHIAEIVSFCSDYPGRRFMMDHAKGEFRRHGRGNVWIVRRWCPTEIRATIACGDLC